MDRQIWKPRAGRADCADREEIPDASIGCGTSGSVGHLNPAGHQAGGGAIEAEVRTAERAARHNLPGQPLAFAWQNSMIPSARWQDRRGGEISLEKQALTSMMTRSVRSLARRTLPAALWLICCSALCASLHPTAWSDWLLTQTPFHDVKNRAPSASATPPDSARVRTSVWTTSAAPTTSTSTTWSPLPLRGRLPVRPRHRVGRTPVPPTGNVQRRSDRPLPFRSPAGGFEPGFRRHGRPTTDSRWRGRSFIAGRLGAAASERGHRSAQPARRPGIRHHLSLSLAARQVDAGTIGELLSTRAATSRTTTTACGPEEATADRPCLLSRQRHTTGGPV